MPENKTAFLGNMANQRRDLVALMGRMQGVIKQPQASYETRRWKDPQPLDYRVNDGGKAAARKKMIEIENQKLSREIYHILTENRSKRTVEYNPGWRISKGGKVVIDCYETQRFGAKEYGALHGREQASRKELRARRQRDEVLKRNIAKLQSQYNAKKLLKDYVDKRELYDKTPRFSATLLHLDLVGARKDAPVTSTRKAQQQSSKQQPQRPQPRVFAQQQEWNSRYIKSEDVFNGSKAALAARDAVYQRYQNSIDNKAYYASRIAMANIASNAVRVNREYSDLVATGTSSGARILLQSAKEGDGSSGTFDGLSLPRIERIARNKQSLQRHCSAATPPLKRPSSALPYSSYQQQRGSSSSSRSSIEHTSALPDHILYGSATPARTPADIYEDHHLSESFLLPRMTQTRPQSASALECSRMRRGKPYAEHEPVDVCPAGADLYNSYLAGAVSSGASAGEELFVMDDVASILREYNMTARAAADVCRGLEEDLYIDSGADEDVGSHSVDMECDNVIKAEQLRELTSRKMLLGRYTLPCYDLTTERGDAAAAVVGSFNVYISDFGYLLPRGEGLYIGASAAADTCSDTAVDYVSTSVGFVFEAEPSYIDDSYLQNVIGCETVKCSQCVDFIDINAAVKAFASWDCSSVGIAGFEDMLACLKGCGHVADNVTESLFDLFSGRPSQEQALCEALLRLVRVGLRRGLDSSANATIEIDYVWPSI